MHAEIYAEWLRRQGYRVARTSSSYWYEASPRIYQAFPYHWLIEPQEEDLPSLLRRNRAIALRCSTPLAASQGKLSYHVVCEGPSFELTSLPRQARQNIGRALDYARVEPIPLTRLAVEGWALRADTLARQGRARAETQAWWQRLCATAEGLPGFEAWGAVHDGKLVASLLAFTCDNWCTVPYAQSASEHLRYRVNNGLFHQFTVAALARPGVDKVFLGLHSLDAPESVDEFKFRMGFLAKPVRQRVVFHPWLAPFVGQPLYSVVQRLLCRHPNPALSKAEGMLRFCLEGRRPPAEQQWPECLADRREDCLRELQPLHAACSVQRRWL